MFHDYRITFLSTKNGPAMDGLPAEIQVVSNAKDFPAPILRKDWLTSTTFPIFAAAPDATKNFIFI